MIVLLPIGTALMGLIRVARLTLTLGDPVPIAIGYVRWLGLPPVSDASATRPWQRRSIDGYPVTFRCHGAAPKRPILLRISACISLEACYDAPCRSNPFAPGRARYGACPYRAFFLGARRLTHQRQYSSAEAEGA